VLADDIALAKQREQIAAWDRGEAAIRSELTLDVPARSLSADIRDRFSIFEKWCAERSVRRLPAKPWVVAAFIQSETANGRDAQSCMALLAAIEAAHDSHNLSNPVATAAVRQALEGVIKSEAPRSWDKEQKAEWAKLPPEIRQTITMREKDREVALARKFNELAEMRKRLQQGEADKPIAQTNGKDEHHVSTAQV
jgi:hypothetical protein